MVKLSFTQIGYNDYNAKRDMYIETIGTMIEFETVTLAVTEQVVASLDITVSSNMRLLAYMAWSDKNMRKLLENDTLLKYLCINYLGNRALQNSPNLQITGCAGYTPLGGPRAVSSDSIPYYSLLKFIGQYTKNQEVYDMCVDILKQMPKSVEGPIMNPPDILYLLNYNFNVDTSNNPQKEKVGRVDKTSDFHYSVYQPNPSFESEYNERRRRIFDVANELSAELDTEIGWVVLADYIINSHYHVMKDTESLEWHVKYRGLPPNNINRIEEVLIKISSQEPENNEAEEDVETQVQARVNEELRFIDPGDKEEMQSIAIECFVYVNDSEENSNDPKMMRKKLRLTELYEQKKADPDSKFSHQLMRDAVKNGILWLVKFLVSKGVPTRNLPVYGERWTDDAKQLMDILNYELKISHGYSAEYIEDKNRSRQKIKEYLKENDLL